MTEAQWIEKAIKETGCKRQNAKFRLAFVFGTNGGSFIAEFNGQFTEPIAFPPAADDFKTALQSLVTIGEDGVKVNGALGGPYDIEMVGANAGQVVPDLVINGADLTPAQAPVAEVIQQGDTGDYQGDAETAWTENATAGSDALRFLLVKRELLQLRLAKASGNVDTITGQANRTDVKQSQEFDQIERLWLKNEAAIEKETRSLGAASTTSYGGVMRKTTPSGRPFGVMGYNEKGEWR